MIWFFITLSVCLIIALVKVIYNKQREDRIQAATLESLLAIIGDEDISLESSKKYFKYLEKNLNTDEFNEVLKNIAFASNVQLAYESDGSITQRSAEKLVPIFNNYIVGVNQRIKEKF